MSERGFYHPDVGYWQSISDVPESILSTYPEGTVEVPLRPNGSYDWSGTEWVVVGPTVADLKAYAAAKRYTVETDGITVGGAEIDTGRDSQAMLPGAAAYVASNLEASISFKASSGWVVLSATEVTAVALAVGAHVQACFAAEQAVNAAIDAGTITTTAEIDAWDWPA